MISLLPVPAFTPDEYRATSNFADEATMHYFMLTTRHFYRLEEEGKLLGLMGLVPPTALSRKALIWFGPMSDASFSFRHLREGKQLSEVFFRQTPYSIYAEIDSRNKATVNFARFFGMSFHSKLKHIHLYVREK